MKKSLILIVFVLFSTGRVLLGQGVTTASMKGSIVDNNGKPLNGVKIIVKNTANGNQYGTMTFDDGNFKLQGLQVGGPYKVIASLFGYKNSELNNIYLSLNQTTNIKLILIPVDQKLNKITINKKSIINSDLTGAETYIGSKYLNILPSISRGLKDFTRLTPQSDGNSFGGRNNFYNYFSIDGSIFNNSYGRYYALAGEQSDAQPVSLDAIKQIQVSLTPFDVREG